ncbi:MAG: BatA domain-containing protein [Kiritimatiellia bacterium]
MTFLAPWLIAGVLVAGVPLVIHLLNRPRYRPEPWGAMQFLVVAVRRRSRTIKLQQILLLVLRMLFFVLLALALSLPVLRAWNIGTGKQPTTHVFIFDGSYSMRQGQHKDNAFHKTRESALNIVDEMRPQDNALIIVAGQKPRAVTPRPLFNKADIQKKIERLEPGWETADLPKAIEYATWLLDFSAQPRHRIYLLTDCQEHGWGLDKNARWTKTREAWEETKLEPHLYVLSQPAEEKVRNYAIIDFRFRYPLLDIHRPGKILAEIQNYTSSTQSVELVFSVDNREVERGNVALKEGITSEDFGHKFDEAGAHAVTVEIFDDDMPVDNKAYLAMEVLKTIPVLLVEGGAEEGNFAAGGSLLEWALEAGGTEKDGGLFRVDTVDEVELDKMDFSSLLKYKSVILANVSSLPPDFITALTEFVRDGGGLMIGLGSNIKPATYNRLYKGEDGLMPASIGEIEEREIAPLIPSFPAGRAVDVLRFFDVSRTRKLNEARVESFYKCNLSEDTTVVGLLADMPFLMVKPFGEGIVVLWSTTFDLEWTNFGAIPDFVPLMQNLAFYMSSAVVPPINLAQGETLVYSYSRAQIAALNENPDKEPAPAPQACRVITPEGETNEVELLTKMGETVGYWPDTMRPGIYEVEARGVPNRYYAVHLPYGEGDLSKLDEDAKESLTRRLPTTFVKNDTELQNAIEKETGVRDLSSPLAWLAILVLVTDLILSWRFSG